MSSSLRQAPIEQTLLHARSTASRLGITRVTDTTWLDKIGIPVFSSIRPTAKAGSLCVNAGKGLRTEEARVGAYMEAIEFAIAEVGASDVQITSTTPRRLMARVPDKFTFVDLCPRFGVKVDPDGPIASVEAEDAETGATVPVPAELVFVPFDEVPGQRIFGSSSNGLCSGNSVLEASVHGLAEVIERDVQAFNFMRDRSEFVYFDEPIPTVDPLIERIQQAGLEVVARCTSNEFELPYFQAFILEKDDDSPIAISCGSGVHPFKEIALVRAVCEAAQSRLSYIHGGRDDLIDRFKFFDRVGRRAELVTVAEFRKRTADRTRYVRYSQVADHEASIWSLEAAWQILLDSLHRAGMSQVLRVVFTREAEPLQVLKIVVPKLESFEATLKRTGPRLSKYVRG